MTKYKIDVYNLIQPEIHKLRRVGIETANLDCKLLLSKSLGLNKTLHNHQNINISDNEFKNFKNFIKQRLTGKPVSRIINKKNFWDSEFELNDETLDPRPASETLIDTVLSHFKSKKQMLKILDLGSGSGCLGLSLLKEFPNSEVSFLDISKKSLEVVKINAQNFGLYNRSNFVNLDWSNDKSLCIVLCSKGYPEKYYNNIEIKNLKNLPLNKDEFIFHAGTQEKNSKIYSNGGRVLNFVIKSEEFKKSRDRAIHLIDKINWENGFFRKDIGYKVIK